MAAATILLGIGYGGLVASVYGSSGPSVAQQAELLRTVVLPDVHEVLDKSIVKVFWVPRSGILSLQHYERDTLEVADGI